MSTSPRSEIYTHGNQITDVDTAREAICEKDFTQVVQSAGDMKDHITGF